MLTLSRPSLWRLWLLLSVIAPVAVSAQGKGTVCNLLPNPIDSVDRIVTLRVTSYDETVLLPSEFLDTLGSALAKHLKVEPDTNLRVIINVGNPINGIPRTRSGYNAEVSGPATAILNASVWFALHRDGEVSISMTGDGSGSKSLTTSILSAMQQAFYSAAPFALPASVTADSVALKLYVATWSDSGAAINDSTGKWFPLRLTKLPVYQVKRLLRVRPLKVFPGYPEDLRKKKIEGNVVLAFNVGTDGKPQMQSVDVVSATHKDFLFSVLNALPRFKFDPAELQNGCFITQRVHQPFHFRVK